MLLVTGRLTITGVTPSFRDAPARIWLEDVSFADAAAIVVAEAVIPDVHHEQDGGGAEFPFELRVPAEAIDPTHDYAVRAWVDRDGDGKESRDDLYSEQSYRVLTRGFGRGVTITLGRHEPMARESRNGSRGQE